MREGHPRSFGCLRMSSTPFVVRMVTLDGAGKVLEHAAELHRWETPDGLYLDLDFAAPLMRRRRLPECTVDQLKTADHERTLGKRWAYEAVKVTPLQSTGGSA